MTERTMDDRTATKRFADIIIPDGGSTQGIDMVCKYIQQTVADEVLGETKKEE